MVDFIERYTDAGRLAELLQQTAGRTWALSAVAMQESLCARVRGQDHVIHDLSQLVTRQYAKISRKLPVASLLFVGPTGTGKTELCKAMAEFLFGSDETLISYDCAQFKSTADLNRLVGSPQGYAGGPGDLTAKMQANRRRLILFDEIEKAHNEFHDIFLSVMGQAQLQDQRTNKIADFTESIIVLTSNAEQEAMVRLQDEIRDPQTLSNAVRVHLCESGNFRPEIIGRLNRIYVFRPLDGIVRAEITLLKIRKLAVEYGLTLEYVDPEIVHDLVKKGDQLKDFGARQREQIVEDMLAEPFLVARQAGAVRVRIRVDADGGLTLE